MYSRALLVKTLSIDIQICKAYGESYGKENFANADGNIYGSDKISKGALVKIKSAKALNTINT